MTEQQASDDKSQMSPLSELESRTLAIEHAKLDMERDKLMLERDKAKWTAIAVVVPL